MNTNPFGWTFRAQFLIGFAICAALLGFAVYVQLHDGLLPCPLCIFQRVAFAALGVVLLIGGLHAPRGAVGRRTYGVLALLAAGIGAAIAANHIRLQHLPPDQVPACGPGLDYMLESMPITGVIRQVLTGSGECANVDWSLLGLSMPAWSLLWFVLLAAWSAYAVFGRRVPNSH
jgi:disulfide bond formation protein DsbB